MNFSMTDTTPHRLLHRHFLIRSCTFLLFAALLLLSLSACGQRETHQDYGSAEELHYSAVHTVLPYYDAIQAACAAEDTLYYVSAQQTETGVLPTRLYHFDPAAGECAPLESFDESRKARMQQNNELLEQIMALCAGPEGSLRMAAACVPRLEGSSCYRLFSLDPEGAILWDTRFPEEFGPYPVASMAADADGFCYALSYDGTLLIADSQGEILFCEEVEGKSLAPLADGRVVLLQATADGALWEARLPDPKSGECTVIGSFSAPQAGGPEDVRLCAGKNGYDLFCGADLSLYGLRLQTEEQEGLCQPILTWLNCDVEGTSLTALAALEARQFLVLSSSAALGAEGALLQWHETDPNAEKTRLTLACRQLPGTVSSAILRFNRNTPDCRVLIRDYGARRQDGVDRLTADLNAGTPPDLFCLEGIRQTPLIQKGYLEDLWPWIDGDEQLTREALVQSIFRAMSIDGRLYSVTGGFTLLTAIGQAPLTGDSPGWTLEQFAAARDAVPELKSICEARNNTQEALLEDLVSLYAQSFWDPVQGAASFDSPAFLALLEYAAAYPSEKPAGADSAQWLAEGKQLFAHVEIASPIASRYAQLRLTGRTDTTWIGYPGLGGSGSAFRPTTPLAMSSACKNKAAAWRFLRTVLLPENQSFDRAWSLQDSSVGCMPTNRSVFDAMVREMQSKPPELTVSYVDPYGNPVELMGWSSAEAEAFVRRVEETTQTRSTDDTLAGILRDELRRFFGGQQSAQSAAAAIQRRVQLYLDELA